MKKAIGILFAIIGVATVITTLITCIMYKIQECYFLPQKDDKPEGKDFGDISSFLSQLDLHELV